LEETIGTNPLIQVVILATPTYIIVAEAVHFSPLVHVHRHDAPKRVWVWYPPIKMLHFRAELRRQIALVVRDSVSLGEKVNIVEYDTLTMRLCQTNLHNPDIGKPPTIEELIVCLLNDPERE